MNKQSKSITLEKIDYQPNFFLVWVNKSVSRIISRTCPIFIDGNDNISKKHRDIYSSEMIKLNVTL